MNTIRLLFALAVIFCQPVLAQQELRSGGKGATAASPVTSTSVDANTQALDIYVKGGASASTTTLTSVVTAQLAITASAQQLADNAGKVVCIKVKDGGTQNVYFGPTGVTTSTGMELIPGETACRTASNSDLFFVIAAGTGSTLAYEIWD